MSIISRLLSANKNKNKNESNIVDATKDFRHKIKVHRLTTYYRIALIVAIILVIVAIFYVQWRSKVYSGYEIVNLYPKTHVAGNQYIGLKANIVTYSKDGISCVDMKGKQLWNSTYEMQHPVVRRKGEVVGVADYMGSKIVLMDAVGNIGEINTTLPIRDFAISENGYVATVLEDDTITWIYLYNGINGEKIGEAKTTMRESGYPLAIALSPDGKIMGVSHLYIDGITMKSSVAFYNFGEVGKNEINNNVSAYSYSNTIIPYLSFLNNDQIIAVGDDRLSIYKGNEKPKSVAERILNEEIISVYTSDKNVGLVYCNVGGDTAYRIDIYNSNGDIVFRKEFDIEYTDIVINGSYVIIYNQDECLITTMDDVDKYSGVFVEKVFLLIPTNNPEKYIIVTGSSIQTIQLRE